MKEIFFKSALDNIANRNEEEKAGKIKDLLTICN